MIVQGTEATLCWEKYFANLLNCPRPEKESELDGDSDLSQTVFEPELSPITEHEVRKALKQMRSERAPGGDGITVEMIKNLPNMSVQALTKCLNLCWKEEQVPEEWSKGIIIPIWKRKRSRLECTHYRGITLLSSPSKLFAKILLNRAMPDFLKVS